MKYPVYKIGECVIAKYEDVYSKDTIIIYRKIENANFYEETKKWFYIFGGISVKEEDIISVVPKN